MVPEKKPIDISDQAEVLKETEALNDNPDLEQPLEFDENSTVLTTENGMYTKKDLKVKPLSVRRFYTVISLLVAVAVFITGTIVVGLLPEKEDENSFENNTIIVKKTTSENIEKVIINGSYGELVFLSKETENTQSTSSDSLLASSSDWELQGYDSSLMASTSLSAAVDNVSLVYASRIMEKDLSKKDLYGLNKPTVTAKVFMKEGKGEDYTLIVGDASPDKSGYYASVTGDNNIYLLATSTVTSFNKKPEEMANAVIVDVPAIENVTKRTDKKYFDEETGSLATYESIEISGSKYGQKAVITPIDDNEYVECSIDLGSYSRYADPKTANELFGIMTNGLVAIDTYVLGPSAADIKKYGLESPEATITIKCGSIKTTIRATMYDKENNYYAVMVDGKNAIYAVTADALSMLNYKLEDFYFQFVFQEFIYSFKNMTIETPEKTYSFDIKHNTKDDSFTATLNGKKIDDALLATYYNYLLVLSPKPASNYTDGQIALKATLTYKSESKGKKVIELVKQSARRYLVKIDGIALGIVSSVEYDPLIVYAEYVVNNKGIPEP